MVLVLDVVLHNRRSRDYADFAQCCGDRLRSATATSSLAHLSTLGQACKRCLPYAQGRALGRKYKEKGVLREDLARTLAGLLEQGKINKLYHDSILAGDDKGLSAE